jgi:Mg2+/Co2+ transporter CorB
MYITYQYYQVEGDVSSEDALRAALEKAGHEGELTSKDLDKIWSTFGSELTINDPVIHRTSCDFNH